MAQAGFKGQVGVAGSGPAAYIEDSSGASVAMGLNASSTFVISHSSSPTSTGVPGQFQINSSENIDLIPTDTVDITQGHLRVAGTGGYIVLPPSVHGSPSQGFIAFDSTGNVPSIHFAGTSNTFVGASAGNFAVISGSTNVGVGTSALEAITSGNANCALGDSALASLTSGIGNIAVGEGALGTVTTAENNIGIGVATAGGISSGDNNVIIGCQALVSSGSCSSTVAVGQGALISVGTSSGNIAIGASAASAFNSTESNNITIGSAGVSGDNGIIRLGTSGFHTGCQIAGVSSGSLLGTPYQPVMVSNNGGLGTIGGGTDGQVLIGATGSSPVWATLTAGTNVSITNTANNITINASFSTPAATFFTSDATPQNLLALSVGEGEMITIWAIINAHKTDYSQAYGANMTFTVYRATGGNVTIAGSAIINANNTSTVDVAGVVDVGTQSAIIQITGVAGEDWLWRAQYETNIN